ncbi:hypothetical protein B0H15DRAFT_180191 [Mycena belliarum]|uniref:Uncharacterized protein n=1 Tax=Mycena belliarum TaxID=1033014 RepID=A0AAD6U5M1_9AGAR|nr:hypothetical protein B0H15DRAFT_180191 [Mycena belliae]
MSLSQILKKTVQEPSVFLAARASVLRPTAARFNRYDIIRDFSSAHDAVSPAKRREPCLREDTRSALIRHFHESGFTDAENSRLKTARNPLTAGSQALTPPLGSNTIHRLPRTTITTFLFFGVLPCPCYTSPRPSRDGFLKVSMGFRARARIRFEWFTIKSF